MRDGVHKTKRLKFVSETSFAPVRARAMALVDFIFPSPRCRRAALPSDAGDCQSLFVAARAVSGLRWRSSLLRIATNPAISRAWCCRAPNGMSFPHSVDTSWSVHRPKLKLCLCVLRNAPIVYNSVKSVCQRETSDWMMMWKLLDFKA